MKIQKKKNNKKIKRIGDQDICVLPLGFMCSQLKLRKKFGDCVCERSKWFFALLCIPKTPSIMHFLYLPTNTGPECTHSHIHTFKAHSSAWHLNTMSGEQLWGKDENGLTASSGLVKVT